MTSEGDILLERTNRLKHLEMERRKKARNVAHIESNLAKAKNSLRTTEGEIRKLQNSVKEPIISEHALLRYIQRIEGRDMTTVIAKILTPETINRIKILGDGEYPVEDFKVVVKNNVIVTIIDKNETVDETDR